MTEHAEENFDKFLIDMSKWASQFIRDSRLRNNYTRVTKGKQTTAAKHLLQSLQNVLPIMKGRAEMAHGLVQEPDALVVTVKNAAVAQFLANLKTGVDQV